MHLTTSSCYTFSRAISEPLRRQERIMHALDQQQLLYLLKGH